MAGAGYKLYSTGDVLTASDVNTYIQQQTVMVFADASARTTALSGVVAEGMLTYLKDTDVVQYYSGSGWVTVNTDQTPLTTKGDLFTYSTQDARLAVGNNGETLVADNSASTGLRYQGSMAAGRNFIINGGFDVWQRGTSVAAQQVGFNYVSDRWGGSCNTSGAATVSRQVTGDTTNLPFVQYCARYQRTAGNTATGIQYLNQPIETINSIPLAGKTVTVSFYARAGANFSATSNALNVSLRSGTGTDQNYLGAWTGDAVVASTTATLTTTWQRFQFTGTVSASATELTLPFTYTPTGTAGANDYYEITGVQLEVGSVATQFTRAGGTIAGEYAAALRYYRRMTAGGQYTIFANGATQSTTAGQIQFPLPPMRVLPTSVEYSTLRLYDNNSATAVSSLTINTQASNADSLILDVTCTGAAFTGQRPAWLTANNSTSAYIGFSSEL